MKKYNLKKNIITTTIIVSYFILTIAFNSLPVNATENDTSTPEYINIELDRIPILNIDTLLYPSNSIFKWKDFKCFSSDVTDGYIPFFLITDPVYCSMNLPSESRSDYMIKIGRDNGHIIGNTSSDLIKQVLGIGSLYPTSGQELPDNFSVYLSNFKVFAYSKSQQKWITIDSQPYPCGIYIYTLPWETTHSKKCTNVTYTDSYAKIDLTAQEMSNSVLHFWGKCAPINKEDYIYYACAYSFWVDSSVAAKLTATNGIDTKDITGAYGITQLYSSRGLVATSFPRTHWGHTIPNSEYLNCNGPSLNYLYLK